MAELLRSYASRSNGFTNQGAITGSPKDRSGNREVEDVTIEDGIENK
ncbi:MAG: hypothetical protein ACQEWV_16145 [Bacillota bacterium]